MRIRYDELSPPAGWSKDKIGNRMRLNYGKSQAGIRTIDGTIPIFGTGGLIEYGKQAFCEGDSVLIGRKGTLDNPLYIDRPFWPMDTTYYTSDFDGSMRWFYYLIQTVGLASLNEATGVPSLSRETFYNLEVLFPPVEEQTAIAGILAAVDRAIAQTEALIAKQRRIKAGLLHDLLTRGIDEAGNLRHPSTHRFKPSPLGLVPEAWEVGKLSDYADVLGGKRLPAGHSYTPVSTGYRYLRVLDFFEKHVSFSELASLEEATFKALERYEIVNGDLYISIAGSIGFCGVLRVPETDRIVLTENAAKIRLRAGFVPEFLAMQINGYRVQQQITEVKGTGGGVPKLALFRIENLNIAKPSIPEQTEIVRHYVAIENMLNHQLAELPKLHRLKTGLMQDLLTGRVSVAPLLAILDKTD